MRELFYLLLLVLLACAVFALWAKNRYASLTQRRKAAGYSFDTFQAELRGEASDEVLHTVYDHFSSVTRSGMPVLASDDLGEIYGIVDDDVPDEIYELADKCGVSRPSPEEAYRVKTVGDTAILLETLRLLGKAPPSTGASPQKSSP